MAEDTSDPPQDEGDIKLRKLVSSLGGSPPTKPETIAQEDLEELESCPSFDTFGDILPANRKGSSFETALASDEEDTTAPDGRRPSNPYESASFLSKLLFAWPYSLMATKESQVMSEADLPDVRDADTSEANLRRFHKLWEEEKARARCVLQRNEEIDKRGGAERALQKDATPSLSRAIKRDFFRSLWFVQVCIFFSSVGKLLQALALGLLLESFDLQGGKEGYLWAGLLVGSGLVALVCQHHTFWMTGVKGMNYRSMMIAAVYDKSLRLKSASSSGKAVNLASNDVERFIFATSFGSYLIWSPILSIGILAMGWYIVGWAFAVGFALLVFVVVPFQLWLGMRFAALRSKVASITDERLEMEASVLAGAREAKLLSYEDRFLAGIGSIRKREIDTIQRVNRLRALNEAVFFASNISTAVVIFLIHVARGGILTPMSVFTTMVLVNTAQIELTKIMALGVMAVCEAKVSTKRIQQFLELPELSSTEAPLIGDGSAQSAIVCQRATCYWNCEDTNVSVTSAEDFDCSIPGPAGQLALSNVNLQFDLGTLTCVVGDVGSGKTAMMQMLSGELPLTSGKVERREGLTLAYASQEPFIMQGSVRDNILFGREYDEAKYATVVRACCLDTDFDQLRAGDDTIVGDQGASLSGGQKARVALARVFYRDANIVLLDDPLAAVDAKVGRKLFYAIEEHLVKRGKCVVLATHQHQFAGESRCIVTSEGRVTCVGSYQKCCASDASLTPILQSEEKNCERQNEPKLQGNAPESKNTTPHQPPKALQNTAEDDNKETSNSGVVGMRTFVRYCKAFPWGLFSACLMILLFTATQASAVVCVAAIGRWSTLPDQQNLSIIGTVVGLALAVIILAIIRAVSYFHLVTKASERLHSSMATAVLRTRIGFFDTNPLGRILNRFSADVGIADDLLPNTSFDCLVVFFMVAGAVASACSVLPIVLVAVPPLSLCLVRIRRVFIRSSREIKRMEGMARSPVFAVLNETLSGLSTIRSNESEEYYQAKFFAAHNAHGRAFFSYLAATRWFGFRCDGLVFVFYAITSFAAVFVNDKGWLAIDPSILGLALSMLIQLSAVFQWGVRQSAEVENQMTSIERLIEFCDLPSEAALATAYDSGVGDEWPSTGTIDVQGLDVRYRPGLPLSLRSLTFKIEGGSRVGCVGRTGAGKSSLVQSLLRLLEADAGQILIDSVDISKLGLSRLRKSVGVIPQTPVLYDGLSVRDNLDPFKEFSDDAIEKALQCVAMLKSVQMLPEGLNTIVTQGGSTWSAGQRQLLCLTRAILRKNKVLILDEPTANVDRRTDWVLQQALAEHFQGSTIISIAHRLETVISNDKILVLGAGTVLEYGSPHELIVKGGAFCSMVDDTGAMAHELKERAKNTDGKAPTAFLGQRQRRLEVVDLSDQIAQSGRL